MDLQLLTLIASPSSVEDLHTALVEAATYSLYHAAALSFLQHGLVTAESGDNVYELLWSALDFSGDNAHFLFRSFVTGMQSSGSSALRHPLAGIQVPQTISTIVRQKLHAVLETVINVMNTFALLHLIHSR
jgi:hypothetical protein